MNLNEEQLAVLEHTKGDAIAQAGPDTGKTTPLTAYNDNQIDTHNITINIGSIDGDEGQCIFNSIEQGYL